jgi:K+/H+ antiporter YhaU regulatory subunit KhtT
MTDKYLQTDVAGLVKDTKSQAVLNVDNKKLEAYRRQKQVMNQTVEQSQRLENVEQQISEIKQMFNILLEKLDSK